jgi:hypothetical protein
VNTLGDVKKTVRSLIGDDEGSWTNDGYLVPKINFAYRTAYLKIKTATGQALEQLVQIPDFTDANGNDGTTGITSLAAFQQPGKPLCGLYQPMFVYWKPAGAAPRFYREAVEKQTLPFTQSLAGSWYERMYWTWQHNTLQVTPLNLPIDILVDGRFNPPPLVKDEDVLVVHPDMETAVSGATLGIVGVEAGNSGFQQTGEQLADQAIDNICNLLTLAKQGYTQRGGRMARPSHLGWFWW